MRVPKRRRHANRAKMLVKSGITFFLRVPKRRRHANRAKMLVKSGMVPAGTPQARYAGSRSGPFRGTRYAVHRKMRGARSASVVVSAVRGTRYTALPVGTLGTCRKSMCAPSGKHPGNQNPKNGSPEVDAAYPMARRSPNQFALNTGGSVL